MNVCFYTKEDKEEEERYNEGEHKRMNIEVKDDIQVVTKY